MTEPFGLDFFEADHETLTQVPATVRLRWGVRGAVCVLLSGHGQVHGTGQPVVVHTTTTFVLTAYAPGLAAAQASSVTVHAPEPAPSPEIPTGSIVAWHGDPRRIPAGWKLCDGRDGTPNLVDRFILGADTDAPAGKQGDGDGHRHAVTYTVTGRTDAHRPHSHALPWKLERAAQAPGWRPPPFRRALDGIGAARGARLGESGGPAHGLGFERTFERATSEADPPEPPWHALCYIIRERHAG
jgi:hypothetical protein